MTLQELQDNALELTIADRWQLISSLMRSVRSSSAMALGLDAIVTRDTTGFAGSPVSILSPTTLRNQLNLT
jgi:CTP-dependent riboflavin kinase